MSHVMQQAISAVSHRSALAYTGSHQQSARYQLLTASYTPAPCRHQNPHAIRSLTQTAAKSSSLDSWSKALAGAAILRVCHSRQLPVSTSEHMYCSTRQDRICPWVCRAASEQSGSSTATLSTEDLIEWDIVEYIAAEEGSRRLGKVLKVQPPLVEIEPLVEEEDGVWVADDAYPDPVPVASSCLVRIVSAEYGQRQDRGPCNPHGEHAHDIWQIADDLPRSIYRGKMPRMELPPGLDAGV